MSTNIRVDVTLQRLQNQSRQATEQNRSERQQREEGLLQSAAPQAVADPPASQREATGARRESPFDRRRPAAQRELQTLVPFALSWRGTLTPRTPTVYEVQLRTLLTGTVPPSIFTYSGGDYLAPNAFQISSAKSLISVPQAERYSEWKTTGKIAWQTFYGLQWTYEGFWAETLLSDIFSTYSWTLPSCPGNLATVGPMSHSTTGSYLAVGTDGTIFITVAMPYEAIDTASIQTPSEAPPITTFYRDIYYSTVNEPFKLAGLQQYVNVGGVNQYNGLPVGPYGSKPLHTFAGQPYLFLKVQKGQISSQSAIKTAAQSWASFYAANAWPEDPGKELRGTYAGEVRIRGNQAHLLRMRYEEIYEGDTYTYYEDFPFTSLNNFVTGTGANATLQAGVTFEDHIYDLTSYTSSSQLAEQLNAIQLPNGFNGEITYPPDQIKPVSVPATFISAAAKQISTSGPDVLTPITYFVAMP